MQYLVLGAQILAIKVVFQNFYMSGSVLSILFFFLSECEKPPTVVRQRTCPAVNTRSCDCLVVEVGSQQLRCFVHISATSSVALWQQTTLEIINGLSGTTLV